MRIINDSTLVVLRWIELYDFYCDIVDKWGEYEVLTNVCSVQRCSNKWKWFVKRFPQNPFEFIQLQTNGDNNEELDMYDDRWVEKGKVE